MYSADLVPGDIPDDTMDVDESFSDDNDDIYEERVENTDDMTACQVFNVEMEMKEELRDTKGVADWPSDASNLNFANALQSIPRKLFNFIAWIVGASVEPELQYKVSIPRDKCCKVASICQDLTYAEAKAKKTNSQSLAPGMTVRQLTGSRKLFVMIILCGPGHTASSDTVCTHDSALATLQTSDSSCREMLMLMLKESTS